MKTDIWNNVTRTLHRTGLRFQKHSPEILLATGVVGTVATVVLACKATTKVHSVLEETKDKVNTIHKCVEDGEAVSLVDGEEKVVAYSQEDCKKDLTITYSKAGIGLIKLYGPAFAVGVASLTCILASHNIIHKRNVALAAAYTTIDNGFREYRGRVIERFGKDLDRELKYNIQSKETEEIVVDEDGKEKIIKETVREAVIDEYSDYARIFDDKCLGWKPDWEYNLTFLKQIQHWANDKLKAQGHLYLNEVYEMLGFPKTKAGQVVGWIYNNDDYWCDGYIDFGLYDLTDEERRAFINGRHNSIIIDFNVDGNIWEKMA